MKEVKDMTFDELSDTIVMRMHLALLKDGSAGMKSEMYCTYNMIQQWQDSQGKKKR